MSASFQVAGRTVHAATGGVPFDNARPLIIFLHGAGMDHTVWTLQARCFAWRDWAILAPDWPGHGRSEGPPLTGIGAMAEWVWQLVDAAGAGSVVLVGHSMGALAALAAAAQAPDRCRKLALVGAAAAMPVNAALLDAARDDPAAAARMIVSWSFAGRGHFGGARTPGMWLMGGGLSLLARGASTLHADFAACNAYDGGLDAAARVACPALVVSGAGDRMTPPRAARPLIAALPDAREITIADCGHMHMVEQPGPTLDALTGFL